MPALLWIPSLLESQTAHLPPWCGNRMELVILHTNDDWRIQMSFKYGRTKQWELHFFLHYASLCHLRSPALAVAPRCHLSRHLMFWWNSQIRTARTLYMWPKHTKIYQSYPKLRGCPLHHGCNQCQRARRNLRRPSQIQGVMLNTWPILTRCAFPPSRCRAVGRAQLLCLHGDRPVVCTEMQWSTLASHQ